MKEALDPAAHIAIVAMSGRFPGAASVAELWPLLERGEERIVDLSEDDLRAAGIEEASFRDPRYVARTGRLDGIESFDATLFGYSPGEAARIDPQQRLFLEHAWEAFEAAGYDVHRIEGPVGVFAGTSSNGYFLYHFFSPHELLNTPGADTGWLASEKDFLATRVSYELGLRGPGLTVQTACSTSLVAVHLACQSLLAGECDMALAGGSSVRVPHTIGYFHQPEGILSPDGRCRAYDAEAGGTVVGSGVGAVVLKRYEDAVADGDPIRAVILASAINNDGGDKIGFTAPGVEGQAAVIGDALALAGIDPATVGYVEGHGSGTRLGDPIEVTALNQAYAVAAGDDALEPASCALGSIKTNIGHLDAAAGIAGLIKTVLALERGRIPPSVHFRTPNPRIDFGAGPFYVSSEAADWPRRGGGPRRAAVSSFGLGGTNAHVVLQQAPERAAPAGAPTEPARPEQLLVVSAATPSAADTAASRLADWLEAHPDEPLADVAFTLQAGRAVFPHRRAVVAADRQRAAARLRGEGDGLLSLAEERRERPVAFLLPGLGEDYPGMGRHLYEREPVFRDAIDRAAEAVRRETGADLLAVVRAERPEAAPGNGGLDLRALLGRTGGAGDDALPVEVAQPALFAVELALAELWRSWGVVPEALLGYSLGEYVAACLAGVMPLEQALWLVARRAELVATLPPGAMLAVPFGEEETARRIASLGGGRDGVLGGDAVLGIGAVNGPSLTVVAGAPERVEALRGTLAAEGVACRRLATGHAFHTAAMEPVAERVGRLFEEVDLAPPEVPYVSNATGTWVRDEEATDPGHWVRHFVGPVRFADGLAALARDPARVFLEVGPGSTLGSLAVQTDRPHSDRPEGEPESESPARTRVVVPSLPGRHERRDEVEHLLTGAGKLWLAGAALDWEGLHGGPRRRVVLPTYPFERKRYWVETIRGAAAPRPAAAAVPAASAAGPGADDGTAPIPQAHARPGLTTPYEPPRTDLERELAAIWSELLGIAEVGRRDSFFELGGHSLLATQLVARLADRHGVELTLVRFFETPTVAALAEWLEGERRPKGEGTALPRRPADRGRPPLSFAQQRAWLIHRLEPDNPSYNIPNVLRLAGSIDLPALRDALVALGRRQEVLRTTFGQEDGRPVQVIRERAEAALPLVDLSGLPEAVRRAAAERVAAVESARPFDLERGPVVRTLLVRTGHGGGEADEHLFVVTIHHASADGWSLGIFVRELAALYAGRELPPLPVQYADFAHWQRERLRGERLDALLAAWRERLAPAPRAIGLPTDRPRPPRQGWRGRRHRLRLERELLEPLLVVGRAHGATPFMTLLAAFMVLLHRWSGAPVLPIGTPIANRTRPEIEPLIGFFANTLVVVGDLSDAPTFSDLLDRVRATALDAFDHQDLPFERLVEGLEPDRDLSRSPLFQVMFALQNAPRESLRAAGVTIEPVDLDPRTAKFDLMLELHEDERGGVHGYFEYAVDLFDDTTLGRLAAMYRRLVASAGAEPGLAVTALDWLPAALRHQVTHEWPAAVPGAAAGAATLHAAVERVVESYPDAVALVEIGGLVESAEAAGSRPRHLTYGELDRRAAALATELRRRGAGPGAVVGLEAERRAETLVALLAILRAGAAYLPLDPAHPEARRQAVLRSAGVGLTVSADGDAHGASAGRGTGTAEPADLAYVVYTSGSTGEPKGVAMPHAPLAALVAWQVARGRVGGAGTTAQLAPLGFDVSCQEVFTAWSAGGRLVLVPDAARRDPALLLGVLGRERIERLFLPYVALATLARRAAEGEGLPPALADVITSGERLRTDPALRRAFERSAETGAGARLDNQYGPSETHVATAWALPPDPADWQELPPIGRPLPGCRALIADAALRPVPPGTVGELLLGGSCPARGYLGRPALTAERFLPDPFAGTYVGGGGGGGRLYRTGDLVRHRPDGVLEFVGRADDQVKVRGHRIELAEVEGALVTHPGVAQAAVAVRGEGVEARLVAYVVPADPSGPVDERELRGHLRSLLPEPMVPGRVVTLDRLPTRPSGKVDRRSLPAPEGAATESAFVAPRTWTEEAMAAIWRELLEVERVGARDGFFALGGHSLLAARLVSRVHAELGVDLPLRTVFEHPVLADLAAAAARLRSSEDAAPGSIPPLPRDPDGGLTAAASPAQEGIWLAERLHAGSAYHVTSALRLRGPLVPAAARAGLGAAVRRHETLRTTFEERAGRPVQRIAPPGGAPPPLPVVDLSALAPERRSQVLEPLLERVSALPFDLSGPPERGLVRALLVREESERHALVLTLHHTVCDGGSLPLLVDELVAGYRGEALPPLPIQYADYAAWRRGRIEGGRLEEGLQRSRERLAGAATELDLPRDRPDRPDGAGRGARPAAILPFRLGAEEVEPLRRLAEAEEATLFVATAALYQAALGRWSGQDDLLIGAPAADRLRPEAERLIGLFVDVLVLRGRLGPTLAAPTAARAPGGRRVPFRRLLAGAREDALAAIADQEVPFEAQVERLEPERGGGGNALVQAVLAYQGRAPDPPPFGAVTIEPIRLRPAEAKFDLTLEVEERDGGLSGVIEYRADRFDRTTIVRFREHLRRLAQAVAREPDRPLDEIGALSEAERHAVLIEWSSDGRSDPDLTELGAAAETADSLVARFRARVERAPESVALVEGGDHVSYEELARRADALARRLRRDGVAPGEPVGVFLDRSSDAVASLLGVLAAGGAYVPLDPKTPEPRLLDLVAELGLRRAVAGPAHVARARAAGVAPIGSAAAGDPGPAAALPEPLGGLALAYVVFTSGSTGRPKAVGATHAGVIRLVHDPGFTVLGTETTLLQAAPLAFDASTLEIWGALVHGGRLVIAPPGAPALSDLSAILGRERITHLWLTAGLFHQMVEAEGEALAEVPVVLTGGDVVSPELAARHLAACPADGTATLVHAYGPTEATTFATTEVLRPAQARGVAAGALPIGRPIAETRVSVAGPDLRPVPIGTAGELLIGGAGLARGYLGRPAATAERFVPDPFPPATPRSPSLPPGGKGTPPPDPPQPIGGGRVYRTGDRARFRPDGAIDFLGRLDRQVKVRGFRVEPGEVESVLERHPGVARAVVSLVRGKSDARGTAREDRLIAWWVPSDPDAAAPDARALRRFAESHLPRAAVPSEYLPIDEIPLTANGKIDRRALPLPEPAGAPAAAAPSPAALDSPLAAELAGLWGEILGAPPAGPDPRACDFFDSGGHSLHATRLVARVRQALGVEIPLSALFERPTFGALVDEVAAARAAGEPGGAGGEIAVPEEPEASLREAPLSFAQERLWLVDALTGGTGYYNVPVAVELDGRLDLSALAGSFRTIEARHDALRSHFEERDGRPVQVVADPDASLLPLPVVDLTRISEAAPERAPDPVRTELRRLAAAEAWRPFDLAAGPLWRVRVLRVAPDRHAVLCTMHHVVSDGWSTGVLLRELGEGYRARVAGRARVAADPLPLQYPEYARRQRAAARAGALDASLDWWRHHLTGAPAMLEVPADRPRPRVADLRGAGVARRVPREVVEGLERWGRQTRSTLFMTLWAAFQVALARWSGQRELVVGTPVANRREAELDGMIGFFVNMLALRSDPALGRPEASFRELAEGVRRDVLDAYRHQDVPFERVVEELVPRRELSRQPLVQVVLALQNAPGGAIDLPGTTLTPIPDAQPPAARFDLTLSLEEGPDGLAASFVYPPALFERATVERLADGFGELLREIAADPERRIEELPAPALDGHRPRPVAAGEIERLAPRQGRVAAAGAPHTAPRSPLEATIAEAWCEVLGLDEVGVFDDFFDLGGHSLLATQVVARLRRRLERELSPEDLFEAPTVAALADRLVRREAEEIGDDDLAALLAELDDLSDEEVEDQLRAREEVTGGE